VRIGNTTVKSEKVDSEVSVGQEALHKPVVTFKAPSTATPTINQSNVLAKRKQSHKDENIDYYAKRIEKIVTRATDIENTIPATSNVSLVRLCNHGT
jgi:hypothetical protein